MPPTPRAITCQGLAEFLSLVIQRHQQAQQPERSILVTNCTEGEFREQLREAAEGIHHNDYDNWTSIEVLDAARHVDVVCVPSHHHMRAYLSTLFPSSDQTSASSEASSSSPGLLAIWGLVDSHFGTAEFAAQGLGRSIAVAVDAALRCGRWLLLGERIVKVAKEERDGWEAQGLEAPSEITMFDLSVPVLNLPLNMSATSQSTNTVEVRAILGTWCTFESE